MDVVGPIVLALSVALAVMAVVWVWRLRRGQTTVQRWQFTLPWVAWVVLVAAFLASFVADVAAVRVVTLGAFGALVIAAVALALMSWVSRRQARSRDLELGLPPHPAHPGHFRPVAIALGVAFAFMIIVLPWLAIIAASPPYPSNLITGDTMIALAFMGIGLGVVVAIARHVAYLTRVREHQALSRGIEARVAAARGDSGSDLPDRA